MAGSPFTLDGLIDLMPDAVLIADQAGMLVVTNRRAEELFGYSKDELRTLSIEALIPERFRANHLEHRAAYSRDPRVRPMGATRELFARRKDGSEFPTEISLSPLKDERGLLVVAAVRDKTEHRRLETSLRLSEERLRLLVGAIQEYAIFMLDVEGRVTTWNAGAERLKGYASDEVLGRHFSLFYPPEDVRTGKPTLALEIAARDGHFSEEGTRVRKNGLVFQADITITAIRDKDGKLYGFAKVTRDVTEQKRAQHERAQAVQAREELLAVVAHDLQNAVNALGLNTQVLLRARPSTDLETLHRHAQLIDRSCQTIHRLLRDILDAKKLELGRLEVERRPHPLTPLVNGAVAPLQALAAQKSVRLEARLTTTCEVLCDDARIVQVIQNLVGNAIKFVHEGGWVAVDAEAKASEVRITVADNGPGIDPDDLPHVFDRYWHSGHGALRRGSGLGLFIVKSIVEAHGGRTWVESSPSTGSRFHFTLEPHLGAETS